ncbi:ubiquitin-protein ligase E3/GCN5-related N acetyltransferase fusion protein [Schizosaccharomyces osmophilus]|uniref:Ubiquitin-protein ligase E3/GCN5-related N acetyltransferase fusion protein n=1 Tax=Schizosaccharomyces osmophilus TaxID=2545709 RepID=A0AAF0ART7_9SCHI|nr:ubiquitin-protein ligase E3/GCN5-related N acetyltransferase fusion protein [Schizosaccharomyces osmophilus]WBW70651.1 ubiquitin-protein ligase E3/GCN5-related N acetyltransferase fusion protein [Schizosaccharomyces osmophilus]
MVESDNYKEQTKQNNGVVPIFQQKRKGRDREGLKRKKPNVESNTLNKSDHSDEDEDEVDDIRSTRDYLLSQQKKQARMVPDASSDHYKKKEDQNSSISKDINVEYSANLNVHGDEMNTSTVIIPNESSNDEESAHFKKQCTLSSDLFQSQNDYSKFLPKKEPISKKAQTGPVRPSPSSAAIRTITVIDYQPDVCKDYKLTGFCGYGDTCKFLHMREDYKAGWQLDQEWNEAQSKFRKGIKNVDGVPKNEKEEEIPFVCLICKKDYKDPIVTVCKHHFCENCAVERYRKTPTCVQCGADTKGLFSIDKQMNLLLKKRKQEETHGIQPKEVNRFQPISKENLVSDDILPQEKQDKEIGQPDSSDTTVDSVASNKPISRYSLVELTNENINSFKRLNQVVLNTNYSETFYKNILKDNELSRVALFENKVVGGLSCVKNRDELLYIATFSVLAPYRNLGIGSLLLDFANRSAHRLALDAITLHVRCSNEDSVDWYTRRGFKIIERVPKLYKRFADGDSDAFLMRRDLDS